MVDLNELLTAQRDLQVKFGYHFEHMTTLERVDYIKEMVLALTDELHEVLGEVDWKSWTHGERHVNVDGVKKELVDAFHMFMNLMLVVDMTASELGALYARKHQVNITRQESGYDGRSTKCPSCRRALEDVTLTEIKLSGTNITDVVLCECGTSLDRDVALRLTRD